MCEMWLHILFVYSVLLCVKCQYTLHLCILSCVWNVNTLSNLCILYSCVWNVNTRHTCVFCPVCEMWIHILLVYSVLLCVKCQYTLYLCILYSCVWNVNTHCTCLFCPSVCEMWIHTLFLCVKCQYTLYLYILSCVWNVNTHSACTSCTPVCEMSVHIILA